jgi:hypothetical protein
MSSPPLTGDVVVAGYCAVLDDWDEALRILVAAVEQEVVGTNGGEGVAFLIIEGPVDTLYEFRVGCSCCHGLSSA